MHCAQVNTWPDTHLQPLPVPKPHLLQTWLLSPLKNSLYCALKIAHNQNSKIKHLNYKILETENQTRIATITTEQSKYF